MPDYRLTLTDLGWIVFAGDEPQLLMSEESVALQVVAEAQALLLADHARAELDALEPLMPSPSLHADAPPPPLTAPSHGGESPRLRSGPQNSDDASPRRS
ncbi:MAG: hypothetical protein AB1586_08235 [Pseudomonadota bacterium]